MCNNSYKVSYFDLNKMRRRIPLYLVIILGFILRIKDIDEEPVWVDAHHTLRMSKKPFLDLIVDTAQSDVHPPLYYSLVRTWRLLVGSDPVLIRLFSLIFGLVAIYLCYRLGYYLFNYRVGILSALFQAVGPMHIVHSQNMRMYSLFSALLLLSMYYFFKYKDERSNKNMILYVVSSLLLIHIHVYSFFLMVSQGIIMLHDMYENQEKQVLFDWVKPVSSIFLLTTPWLSVLSYRLFFSDSTAPEWLENAASTPKDIISESVFGVGIWFSLNPIPGVIFLMIVGILLISGRISNRKIIYLILIVITPLILSPTISILYQQVTFRRYFIPWSSLAYIMIAYSAFPSRSNSLGGIAAGLKNLYRKYLSDTAETEEVTDENSDDNDQDLRISRILASVSVLIIVFSSGLTITDSYERTPWDDLVQDIESQSDGDYKVFVNGIVWDDVLKRNIDLLTVDSDGTVVEGFKTTNCTQEHVWYLRVNNSNPPEPPDNSYNSTGYGELKLYNYPNGTCNNR